jgi:phospholipase/lecithinase/hemolysin
MALVRKAVLLMVGLLLFGSAVEPAQAAFSMLQVFGDGISTMTNGPGGSSYYGLRRTNGRVWVEVLAQRQGLTLFPTNNWSYFGNTSAAVVTSISSFTPPSGTSMSNILFVIWVNNADLFYPALNNGTNINAWTNTMRFSLTNHFKIITNLYMRGARTLIMPNAVDLSTIPEFNQSSYTNFFHQMCTNYDGTFANLLNQTRTNSSYPGLTIYMPDFFTLLTNLIAYPASYTVTNALNNGYSIDAIEDPSLLNKATNGPGTNYIFWDYADPSAKVHMWMANTAQQLLSPAQISTLTAFNGSNQLVMANVPIGQNGLVLGCTNLASPAWQTNATFVGTNLTQSVWVTNSGPQWFYRLRYLYSWTWP